jgi:hypothetical protein
VRIEKFAVDVLEKTKIERRTPNMIAGRLCQSPFFLKGWLLAETPYNLRESALALERFNATERSDDRAVTLPPNAP